MNVINITAPNAVHLTEEEVTLFDLLHTCGLSLVIKNAYDIDPILFYLQYGQAAEHGSKYDLSYSYFAVLERSFWSAARWNLAPGDAHSFMWIYRHLSYELLTKLLRAKLNGGYRELEYLPSTYKADHPSFVANEAKWAKYCTLLAIEGFPIKLGYRLDRAIDWFSSYESLEARFEDHPVILKMRQSLLRAGNRGHHDFCAIFGRKALQLRPHTAGVRKYMTTRGFDRLAMMRQYTYDSKKGD